MQALTTSTPPSPPNPRAALDDKTLSARAAAGDDKAFTMLVQRHYDRAIRVAFGVLRNHHDAEDVVQEAFLRVHRRLADFAGCAAFYTWLYRIVVNVSIDAVRKRRRERRVDIEDNSAREAACAGRTLWPCPERGNPDVDAQRRELRERLGLAFDRLPGIHRSVILLREVEGHSYEEIANTLVLKKGTVMSRLFHARRSMQRFLLELEAEEERRLPAMKQRPTQMHASRASMARCCDAIA